jgi:(1->4)-alpha-D-glucan 1-alpha-D-glucosylmutase
MHIPAATYRLQLTPDFTFASASRIVPYLHRLGISDLYASPVFRACAGSIHGYNVADPNQLNPELGGEEGFSLLTGSLKNAAMYLLQDIVPNHMAYHPENAMLMDVLENGRYSPYFRFFDIDWDHPYENMKHRILAPFLGKFYAEALEEKEIQLYYDESGFGITYYELRFPLSIESYTHILEHNLQELEQQLADSYAEYIRFAGIVQFFKSCADDHTDSRGRQIAHGKNMLWRMYSNSLPIRRFIDNSITFFNGAKGDPDSFNPLDRLITQQRYRLSFWKVATEEINYRRFFTINDLISVNANDPQVFDHMHRLVFSLVDRAICSGLRIDHIDGLYDPERYLAMLRDRIGPDTYLVIEKILDADEHVPESFPVQGTTGYTFTSYVNNIFCDPDSEDAFTRLYHKYTGFAVPYEELLAQTKRTVIEKHMTGTIDNLAQFIKMISIHDRHGLDITLHGLRSALVEVMAFFPVYRTYINNSAFRNEDRQYILTAVQKARIHKPDLVYELNFIEMFLLLKHGDSISPEHTQQWIHFVMSFQQYTGSVMAKAVEDTFFYIYNRLISLNEVGGCPKVFGMSVQKFHEYNSNKARRCPHELNATATHDTKRGEDVRARLNVLSEIPDKWESVIKKWARKNSRHKTAGAPDSNDEYLLYQTLVGSYPFDAEDDYTDRISAYMIKAVREAKIHTAWIAPDTEYEDACRLFIEKILPPGSSSPFLKHFIPFQKKIAFYGIFNSLSQALIKMASPGVPDFYQGCELWDFSLVDPDNRRPVDWDLREEYLNDIIHKQKHSASACIEELLASKEDGRIKLFLIHRCLAARHANRKLFDSGEYLPVAAAGKYASSVIAFARIRGRQRALIAAPRFLTRVVSEDQLPLGDAWRDTELVLPGSFPEQWRDAVSDMAISGTGTLALSSVFARFPGALLLSGS